MKIYETAVRKPISTILIFIGVVFLGVFSLQTLSVDMYPEIDVPSIYVITSYPGANASDIETNVTRILEDNLNTVNNLKKITSRSSDNLSVVILEFEWGSNLDEAANDIRDAVSRVQSLLPDEVDQPTIFKLSSSMFPVLMISATANESYAALNKILDDKLVNTLSRINGVGAVSVYGQPEREVQVNVDPKKIEAYGISVEQIGAIIAQENVNVPSGTIDLGNNTLNVKADGEFDSSDQLREVIVAHVGGKDIMLTDVATIKDTLKTATIDERINDELGVTIIVQKQSGANTVDIAQTVLAELPAIQKTLPPDVKLDIIMDGSESIVDSINSLSETVMFAFIFVILVVLFFLGRWRATFIICLTIPVSLLVSFIYLKLTGGTINVISLSSLSIAIGMVVDDAIVVLENITTHIERGSKPREAAIYGTNEVWLAVIATTLTVVAVFLPMTMIGGQAGIMFNQLGWIVSLVIVVSTVAAITLTPMLTGLLLRDNREGHTYKGLGIVFKPIDKFLDKLDNGYAGLLTWAVRHRAIILVSTLGIFVASIFLISRVPSEYFTPSDNGYIEAIVELDMGVGVDYSSDVARRLNKVIAEKYPEVRIVSSSAGQPDADNAFAAMQESGLNQINFRMSLPRSSERDRSIFEIGDSLRNDFARMPEIKQYKVTPGGDQGGTSGGSNLEVKVFGYDFGLTNEVAGDLKERISAVEGTRDVQLSRKDMKPELNVRFDRNKLAYYGLSSATASNAVRNRINGLTASKYREDGDEYDIVVRYAEPFRESMEDIYNITVYNSAGHGIKVSDIATIEETYAPPTIERENRQRVVSVKSSLAPGVALGTVVSEVNAILAEYQVPDGVALEVGGTLEDQSEDFGSLFALLILIIVLVYIVMATQFESFLMPFIIMFTLPFAMTGVFVALYLTNTPLSLVALIGAIMLVGIVVKNGIVMVDFTNLLRERGASVNQAVIAAGKSRLRPVLMTSLTTILGMVPMAFGSGEGSEIWQPMGISVIGGLTFSTLLTLIVIPVVYSLFKAGGIRRQRRRLAAQFAEQESL